MSGITQKQQGAVSIFVVVFTALLITVVTVSFARLMLRETQRAASSDLSQSAYDAALAGVEDAKRVLVRYNQLQAAGASVPDISECNGIADPRLLDVANEADRGVTVGDPALQQAYTCVRVNLLTNDYTGEAGADRTQLVALRGADDFDQIRIEWFSQSDMSSETATPQVSSGPAVTLENQSRWPVDRPPVLEAQFMQVGANFTLDQFDGISPADPGESNTNTLFLYPKNLIEEPTLSFTSDVRRSATNAPTAVKCHADALGGSQYACSATISVPVPVGGGARSDAYLRLTPRYSGTSYRISLLSSGNLVQFDGVQPEVDATGRAGDLFRRVVARVETGVGSTVPYPGAAVDINGNFCKTFRITDTVDGYDRGACTP